MVDVTVYNQLVDRLKASVNATVNAEIALTGEDLEYVLSAFAGALGEVAMERTNDDDFVSDLGLSIVGN